MILGPIVPVQALVSISNASQQCITVVADGTSNTLLFDEGNSGVTVCFDRVGLANANGIADGTSNTIVFGELSGFDVCLSNVSRGVTDGTSNMIFIGETVPSVCYLGGVRTAAETEIEVPSPAPLGALVLGLAVMWCGRRRRQDL